MRRWGYVCSLQYIYITAAAIFLIPFNTHTQHIPHPGRGLPPSSPTTPDDNDSERCDDDNRRITFMVGFWKTRVRPKPRGEDGRPGASMALDPLLQSQQEQQEEGQGQSQQPQPQWVAEGRVQLERGGLLSGDDAPSSSLVGAGLREGKGGLEGPLPCVWERLVGEGKEEGVGGDGGQLESSSPPKYEECFQGF